MIRQVGSNVRAVAGLDLAASPKRCSGYSVINMLGNNPVVIKVKCLGIDEDIVNEVIDDGVEVVAIDAPIMREPRMREVDRLMISRGLRVLPPSFSWMRYLSIRGWVIAEKLAALGIKVIETHPRSAILTSGARSLEELLSVLGIRVNINNFQELARCRDLHDSVIAAVVAFCYVRGCYEVVEAKDGAIYLLKDMKQPH